MTGIDPRPRSSEQCLIDLHEACLSRTGFESTGGRPATVLFPTVQLGIGQESSQSDCTGFAGSPGEKSPTPIRSPSCRKVRQPVTSPHST